MIAAGLWLSAVLGVVFSGVGIRLRWTGLVVVGGIAGLPFMLYVLATNLWPGGWVAIIAQASAAYAVRRGRPIVAWLLLVPGLILLLVVFLAVSWSTRQVVRPAS